MTAAQLDHLVTSLEGVEQQLTVLDPPGGLAPGAVAQMRFHIVEGTNIGNAMVNNVPCVAVIIKAGNSTRTYAFDREKAQSLARMVGMNRRAWIGLPVTRAIRQRQRRWN